MKVYKTKKALIEDLIQKDDEVLDVGFWGQAIKRDDPNYPHLLLKARAKEVYGVDLVFEKSYLDDLSLYQKGSAEEFSFDKQFDVIFAGDLIEHLSNPGLFLDQCEKHLRDNGRLILTTPNAFNFFNLIQKLVKTEPPVNTDHTFYFNKDVLKKLLEKNDFVAKEFHYIDTLRGWGIKRNLIRLLDRLVALFTNKFSETLVVVATKK